MRELPSAVEAQGTYRFQVGSNRGLVALRALGNLGPNRPYAALQAGMRETRRFVVSRPRGLPTSHGGPSTYRLLTRFIRSNLPRVFGRKLPFRKRESYRKVYNKVSQGLSIANGTCLRALPSLDPTGSGRSAPRGGQPLGAAAVPHAAAPRKVFVLAGFPAQV